MASSGFEKKVDEWLTVNIQIFLQPGMRSFFPERDMLILNKLLALADDTAKAHLKGFLRKPSRPFHRSSRECVPGVKSSIRRGGGPDAKPPSITRVKLSIKSSLAVISVSIRFSSFSSSSAVTAGVSPALTMSLDECGAYPGRLMLILYCPSGR